MALRSKSLIVALLTVVFFAGVFPQERARAYAPPVPIAPPVTGLCVTPGGVVACLTALGGAAAHEAYVWFDNTVGAAPVETGEWCVIGEHMFPIDSSSCGVGVDIHANPSLEAAVEWTTVDPLFQTEGRNRFASTTETAYGLTDFEAWAIHVPRFTEGTAYGHGYEVRLDFDPSGATHTVCGGNLEKQHLSFSASDYLDNYPAGCLLAFPTNGDIVASATDLGNAQGCNTFSNPDNQRWLVWGSGMASGSAFFQDYHLCHWSGTAGVDHTAGRDMFLSTGTPDSITVGITDGAGGFSESTEVALEFEEAVSAPGRYRTYMSCRSDLPATFVTQTHSDEIQVGETGQITGDCLPGRVPIKTEVYFCEDELVPVADCIKVAHWQGAPAMTETPEPCVLSLASPDACEMWLEQWDGDSWERCTASDGAVDCSGWWTDPNREVVYRCGWGGTYYTASQCISLRDFYDGTEAAPGDVTPENPSPGQDPTPDETTTGTPTQIGGPENPVSARPSTNWLNRIIAEWSTGATASMQDSCWPQGWGLLNPLQWVMRPTMCALTYLFVPTEPMQAKLEDLYDFAGTRVGIGTVTEAGELFGQIGTPSVGGGCGWGIAPVNTGEFTTPEVELILCPSEYGMSTTAATMRSWGYAIVGLWTAGAVYRWISLGRSDELPMGDDNVTGNL